MHCPFTLGSFTDVPPPQGCAASSLLGAVFSGPGPGTWDVLLSGKGLQVGLKTQLVSLLVLSSGAWVLVHSALSASWIPGSICSWGVE